MVPYVPREIFLTKGVGRHKEKLASFEEALRDAKIARFNLTQCKMYAPADGFVVNWQVQEGTMLVPMPMAAAGTFISTADTSIVAAYPQNYLMNVKPGNEVEMIFDTYPGRLFKGEVENVIQATGAGQFAPSGNIPYAAKIGSSGVLAVKIRLTG